MAKIKPQDAVAPAPAPEVQSRPAWLDDEYAGQGGSYEIDPATGKRRLVDRTAPPEATQSKED